MTQLSTSERDELATAVRRFLDSRCSSAEVRRHMETPLGSDPSVWSEMVELGWLAIHVPEAHGGMGGSFVDLAVVAQELGRHVAPGPFLGSAVLGVDALVNADNDAIRREWLGPVLAGERQLSVGLSNPAGSYEAGRSALRWTSTTGGGIRLEGETRFVPEAATADGIVVTASDDSGAVAMALVERLAPGVHVEDEPTMDRTRRLARVGFDGVDVGAAAMLGEPGELGALHDRLTSLGAVAVAADALGAAERMLEVATRYATDRHQFGRAIGSFQAVKHHCANMLVEVEGSRAAVSFATETFDDPAGDIHLAASVAASHAGPACAHACQTAVQVHGGIGFTWEHDAHLHLKRAKLDEALFGDPAWHRRRLAARLVTK